MLKKPHKLRVILLGGLFCVASTAVVARLYDLQIARHDHFNRRAANQQTRRIIIQPERGEVRDCKSRPLAQSTARMSVYVDPKYLSPPEADVDLGALSTQLAYYAHTSADALLAKLEAGRVVAVVRQAEPGTAERVAELLTDHGVSKRGYWLHRETKRLYPRHLASSLIGFCSTDEDGDNKGNAGLEYQWDKTLDGKRIEGTAPRSAISQTLSPVREEDLLNARGNTLVLTLDAAIQEAAEQSIDDMAKTYSLDAAGAVVEDAKTGAILAMASWPTFDNNKYRAFPETARRNRILTDPLETGSVVKLFTASILLDTNKITPDTLVDCEGGHAVIDRRRITDAPGHWLHVAPFREVIAFSSNVGTVKAAQVLENNQWYGYLRAFGIGQKSGIDLPGEGVGILYPVDKWTRLSRTSLPMGYELALTPLQICNGITAIVNGGELLRPYVVAEVRNSHDRVIERTDRKVVRRVIRPTTSALMREIMEGVVDEGTGAKAAVAGFRVGGKTGTTRKSNILDRKEFVASFCGVVPIDDPAFTIYIYADNPKGAMYGGDVAAPAFQAIARAAIVQLGLTPTEPVTVQAAVPAKASAKKSKAAEPPPPPPPDGLPDYHGLTMAEVRARVPESIQAVRFLGTGSAVDQSPAAGVVPGEGAELLVYFRPEPDPPSPTTITSTSRSTH